MVKRFHTRYCYKTGVNAKEIEALIARGNKSRALSGKKQNKMRGKRNYVLETTKTGNVVNDDDQKPRMKTNAVLNIPGENSSNTVTENQKGVKNCPVKMQCASGGIQGSRVTKNNTEVVITSAVTKCDNMVSVSNNVTDEETKTPNCQRMHSGQSENNENMVPFYDCNDAWETDKFVNVTGPQKIHDLLNGKQSIQCHNCRLAYDMGCKCFNVSVTQCVMSCVVMSTLS